MPRLWILGFCILAAVAPLRVSAEETPFPAHPTFRFIRVQVLDRDGDPARQRPAHLIGLSRGSIRPEAGSAGLKYWDFTTDAEGRFSVKLGEFDSWKDPEERPGWGTYAVIVDGAGKDAGAVSNEFVSSLKAEIEAEPPAADWEWGPKLSVPAKGMQLVLHARRGLVLKGRLRDTAHRGHPLAGISVYTNNDLSTDTHTGHGGEIFTQSAVTDADGAFTIRNIYPVKFYVGVGGPYGLHDVPAPKPGYWLKTKVKGRWKNGPGDEIVPRKGRNVIHLEMMGTARPSFSYSGRVVDDRHQPVAGAEVTFGLSYHPETTTFEDDHAYPKVTTDARGNYTLMLGTPWVRGIAVEAKGYARADRWTKSDAPSIGPGSYDFTLHRKQ